MAGACQPGDRIEIITRADKLEAVPLVLATGTAADASPAEVSAYLKRAYKAEVTPGKLCLKHPAFAPELLVVGSAGGDHCLTDMVLARDGSGELVTVSKGGGFGWPEPYIEAMIARGGPDAERATLTWTLQVEWTYNPMLETATGDFTARYAPSFFAPRASTHGRAVWVEAWETDGLGCYGRVRRTHGKASWEEAHASGFCIEDGNVLEIRTDGVSLLNGKPIKTRR